MSLTNRILLAMVAGIVLGSLLEWLVSAIDPDSGLYSFVENGLILGLFDVVGRVFIASLKLLVVPLVMVSLICGMSSLGAVPYGFHCRADRPLPVDHRVAVTLGLTAALLLGPGKASRRWPPPLTGEVATATHRYAGEHLPQLAEGQICR